MIYQYERETREELLAKLTKEDVVQIRAADFLELFSPVDKGSKGRKPISVDEELFDEIVGRWKSGEITAREAMTRLDLKPNTFYRRIKERTELEMKDIKQEVKEVAKAGKQELKEMKARAKEDAKAAKKDMQVLKQKMKEDAKAAKESLNDKKQVIDMEREIRIEKLKAELQYAKEMDSLKDEVARETEAAKQSH